MSKNSFKEIEWKDIKIGNKFIDDSKVIKIHDQYESECYDVFYNKNKHFQKLLKYINFTDCNYDKNNEVHCILSNTHLLLCDISNVNANTKKWLEDNFSNYDIPTLYDKHMYFKDLDKILENNENLHICKDGLVRMTHDELNKMIFSSINENYEVVQSDKCKVSDNLYWLPIDVLNILINVFNEDIYCNKHKLHISYKGKKQVFCIETDTHQFETCGLIHHNSVTLRNIIFHCLTHGEQICIALIDLKYTEFTFFKQIKNVVAVANTVKEASELLRLMRECMYKRNQEMSKIGINDIKDFHPQNPTGEIMIYNRKFNENDKVFIRLKTGEEKEVTVKEVAQYLE